MSAWRFTKMHGAGNDFVVIDARHQAWAATPALCAQVADRHRGIGCDQIMVIEAASAGWAYRIYNADGSAAAQCGNGARCVARWLLDRGALKSGESLHSPSGAVPVRVLGAGGIEVGLGVPRFEPDAIPLRRPQPAAEYVLELPGQSVRVAALSMGNPHAVLRVASVDAAAVAALGPAIERHPDFPDRCNVGFVEVLTRRHLRLRVWERGVGETLACGSGACAAAVAMVRADAVDAEVELDLPGGRLGVRWAGTGQPVYLSGPTEYVYEGEWCA